MDLLHCLLQESYQGRASSKCEHGASLGPRKQSRPQAPASLLHLAGTKTIVPSFPILTLQGVKPVLTSRGCQSLSRQQTPDTFWEDHL